MPEYFLGIDLGTTATKVGLFDAEGVRVALEQSAVAVDRPAPDHVEQDPNAWWGSVLDCWSRIRATGIDPADVVAVGVSGHFSVAFLDGRGFPSRPAITWQDSRAHEEAHFLSDKYDEARIHGLFGISVPFSPAMPAAKFRWVAKNEPEVANNTQWVCHAKDYIALQLCGEVCSDLQSFVGIVNSSTGASDEEYLTDIGLRPSQLPRFTPSYRNAGYTTREARDAMGIDIGVPVIIGWIDAFCSMLATGVYREAAAFDYAGTSEIVGIRVPNLRIRHEGLLALPFDKKNSVLYGLTNCGADALAWAKDALGVDSFEGLLDLAKRVTPTVDLPIFLPYLDGERSPVWDAQARGIWVNLGRGHGRAELAYSVLEGVAYAVWHIIALAEACSSRPVRELVVSGGGARSEVWTQIRADVVGVPAQVVEEMETGALGAAMLAAVGHGRHETMADAAHAMTRLGQRFEPRVETRAIHNRRRAVYRRIYAATKDLRP
ncbi:MAG: FGGY family carbohydrate kinase [Candidatus Poribacteria bacterium]